MIDLSVLPTFLLTAAIIVTVPGPDSLLVLRTTLRDGTKAGLLATLGTQLGAIIQAIVTISGVGLVISHNAIAMTGLRYLGAAYLLVLAVLSWRSAYQVFRHPELASSSSAPRRSGSPLVQGLLCNLTNIKVLLFYLAFFPQFLGQASNTPAQLTMLALALEIVAWSWFLIIVFSARKIRKTLQSPRFVIGLDSVSGAIFLILGLLVLVPTIMGQN